MKKLLLTAAAFLTVSVTGASAQVTIGSTANPQPFSILELEGGGSRGMRLPQLTTVQRNALALTLSGKQEALGLQIFNTATKCVETWNGTKWIQACPPEGPVIPPVSPQSGSGSNCYVTTTDNLTFTAEVDNNATAYEFFVDDASQDVQEEYVITFSTEQDADEVSVKYYYPPSFLKPEMIKIDGGTFIIGAALQNSTEGSTSGAVSSSYQVTLSSFKMSRTPITQAQYEAVMGINESTFRCDGSGKDDVNARPTSDFPVERVNWYQAIAFCNKLSIKEGRKPCYSIPGISALNLTNNETAITGWRELEYSSIPTSSDAEADKWDAATCKWDVNGYRLPTEAEWEYTARGGQKSQSKTGQNNYDYYYSGGNTANNVAWYSGNNNVNGNPRGTKAVGKKTENELGLYDMSGNVWEWCWDWHLNYYTSSDVTNPHGATSGSERILRGGSWDYEAPHCRVSNRGYNNPYFRYSGFGFRVACSAVTE